MSKARAIPILRGREHGPFRAMVEPEDGNWLRVRIKCPGYIKLDGLRLEDPATGEAICRWTMKGTWSYCSADTLRLQLRADAAVVILSAIAGLPE